MILQQSTTFRPFTRQSIVFNEIAAWASQHNILRTVRSAARQWDNVFDMVALFKRGVSAGFVITSSLLMFVLRFYIGSSMVSISRTLPRSLFMTVLFDLLWICLSPFSVKLIVSSRVLLIPLFSQFSYFVSIFFSVSPLILFDCLWMCLCVLSLMLFYFFRMQLFIFAHFATDLFRMIPFIFLRAFSSARMAIATHFISIGAVFMEIFESSRKPLFTYHAAFIGSRLIDHSDVPFASFHDVVGRRWNYRRFGLQSLADTISIPQVAL